jgi:hypothetical protein
VPVRQPAGRPLKRSIRGRGACLTPHLNDSHDEEQAYPPVLDAFPPAGNDLNASRSPWKLYGSLSRPDLTHRRPQNEAEEADPPADSRKPPTDAPPSLAHGKEGVSGSSPELGLVHWRVSAWERRARMGRIGPS